MKWLIWSSLMTGLTALATAQVPVNQKESNSYLHYFQKGEDFFDVKELKQALINYNEAILLNPRYPDAYFSRAVTKEKLGDPPGAIMDYTLYLELKPNQFDALFNRALLNFEQSNWLAAQNDFRLLITLPAGETTSIYYRQDRFFGGTNSIFTSQGTDKSHLFNYLGLTSFELKDFPNALSYFDSAIYHNPYEANYQVNAAQCYESLDQYDKARTAYQTALAINPDHAVAMHNLSTLNRKDGAFTEAAQLLDDVINKNPNLPYPYAERAFYEMNNGELAQALSDYDEAVRLAPTEAAYWNNRGMVKEKLKDWVGAYDDFSQSIRLNEKDEKVWLNRANLFFSFEKYDEAIKDYDVAILLYDSYSIAYYNRALAKHKLNKNKEACHDLKTAQTLGFEVNSKLLTRVCGVQ